MKILVAVKRVIDAYVKVRVKPDGSGVETAQVKMSMNPFDEIALEEALRIRESGRATEVVVVSIGGNTVQETLRHGLALGADRAIHVRSETAWCPLNIARILHQIVLQESPDLVLAGKQSIDGDNHQTPQMLAALLDWPQATCASRIVFSDTAMEVTREVDGGLETLALQLPAVVSADLRLNEPRYATLPNIMKSKSKPLATLEAGDLGISLEQHTEILSIRAPETRKGGVMVASLEALLDKLKHEAKVL